MRLGEPERDDDRLPIVPFVPFRCPSCGRHKPRTYGQKGRKRFHRCLHCNTKYASFELDAKSVPNWSPSDPAA